MGNGIDPSADPALVMFKLIGRYLEGEATVEEIARETGCSSRTIWRRIQAYKTNGVKGLNRAARNDRGVRRGVTPELQEVIEGLYLKTPKPTIHWVQEQLAEPCQRDGIRVPSYTVIGEICRKLDRRLRVLAHDSEAAYEQEFDRIIRRQAKRPNEMWQADHKEFDIWVFNEAGRVGKVWLTGILDDFSRVVPGYYLGIAHANSMRIALALRQAIWHKSDERWPVCGIPEILYTDRGRDFKSTHIEQVCADLKIKVVRTKRRKPRGRGKIERFFRTADQKFVKSRRNTKAEPVSLEKLQAEFHAWLLDEYHQHVHKGIKTPPMVKWNEAKCLPRMPESLEALDLMLHKVARPHKMWNEGIRFNNRIYSDMLLNRAVGQEFTIRYDPRDPTFIWVYAEEDTLLCKAACAELTGVEEDHDQIFEERASIKKGLKKQVAKKRSNADAFVGLPPLVAEKTESEAPSVGNIVKLKLRKHFHEKRN